MGDADISITYQQLERVNDQRLYFWQLGTFAKDALGRSASQCHLLILILDLIFPEILPPFDINPWLKIKPKDRFELPQGLDLEFFETVLLGSAVHEAMEKFRKIDKPEKLLADDGKEFEEIMRQGVKRGYQVFIDEHQKDFELSNSLLKQMING